MATVRELLDGFEDDVFDAEAAAVVVVIATADGPVSVSSCPPPLAKKLLELALSGIWHTQH